MTKLEEVARASFRYWRENATRKGFHLDRPQTFDAMPPDERKFALGHARAVIEAMRNPPDYVLDAMNPSGRYASTVIPEAWNDAIDAILKEGD